MPRSPLALLLGSIVAAMLLGVGAARADGARPVAANGAAVAGEHYVPAHSSVRAGDGGTRIDLAVTLSIHNASQTLPLVLTRIDYYDGSGRRVQSHLAEPRTLAPFATHEVFVAKNDVRGGLGANFVVGWRAEAPIAEPVIEAVTIGDFANQSYAFVSVGRRIEIVGAGAP
ncbi:MAG: DUF3124 domain-containing protein [Siculibacillus sp.]